MNEWCWMNYVCWIMIDKWWINYWWPAWPVKPFETVMVKGYTDNIELNLIKLMNYVGWMNELMIDEYVTGWSRWEEQGGRWDEEEEEEEVSWNNIHITNEVREGLLVEVLIQHPEAGPSEQGIGGKKERRDAESSKTRERETARKYVITSPPRLFFFPQRLPRGRRVESSGESTTSGQTKSYCGRRFHMLLTTVDVAWLAKRGEKRSSFFSTFYTRGLHTLTVHNFQGHTFFFDTSLH